MAAGLEAQKSFLTAGTTLVFILAQPVAGSRTCWPA